MRSHIAEQYIDLPKSVHKEGILQWVAIESLR